LLPTFTHTCMATTPVVPAFFEDIGEAVLERVNFHRCHPSREREHHAHGEHNEQQERERPPRGPFFLSKTLEPCDHMLLRLLQGLSSRLERLDIEVMELRRQELLDGVDEFAS
jgi:hypothetical protein